jgi:succinyl-CoA synthetase beta subunit
VGAAKQLGDQLKIPLIVRLEGTNVELGLEVRAAAVHRFYLLGD